jgi:hypothetical protein
MGVDVDVEDISKNDIGYGVVCLWRCSWWMLLD